MINDNIKRYYVLGGLKNTKKNKHKRGIEKENMKEGIIKRNSINKWMK